MSRIEFRETSLETLSEVVAFLCEHEPASRRESAEDRLQREFASTAAVSAASPEGMVGRCLRRETCWEARRGARLVGVTRGQLLPGGVGFVWMPRLVPGEPGETAVELLRRLERHFPHPVGLPRVALLQVLEPPRSAAEQAGLEAAGFERQPDLLYLLCEELTCDRRAARVRLQFERYDDTQESRLAALMQATYEGTLDYPILNCRRPIEEVIAGYRATGKFEPGLWTLVVEGGRDTGCVLLARHPEWDCLELIYMGLVPQVRGRGLGRLLVERAQSLAAAGPERRILLGVDSSNHPAVRLYHSCGFREIERRQVFLKFLAGP